MAVREYLQFLEDPEQLRNVDAIEATKDELQRATDPLDRLKVLTRLERLQNPSVDEYRDRFIEHAKAWADANDVPPTSFATLGVRQEVLRAAGLITRRASSAASPPPRVAAQKNTSVDAVRAVIGSLAGSFSLTDVRHASGASPMTARKAINQLIQEGSVERVGPDPHRTGQGRAHILFRRRG